MDIRLIDQKLKALVKTERKITHEILLLVQTLDLTQSYRKLKYNSLYAYLTKEIGYSEGAANRRIAAARLMKGSAEIHEAVKNGDLSLSQASLVQSAIRQEERKTRKKVESLLLYWAQHLKTKHEKQAGPLRAKGANQSISLIPITCRH